MKWLAAIILLAVAARAAQTNWPTARANGKAGTAKIEKFKIKAEKTKNGKKETREFPTMFDIADKAAKHKPKPVKK